MTKKPAKKPRKKTETAKPSSKKSVEKTKKKTGESKPLSKHKVPKKPIKTKKEVKPAEKKVLPKRELKAEEAKETYPKKEKVKEEISEKKETEKQVETETKKVITTKKKERVKEKKGESVLLKIKEAKEKSKPRKFTQSWDLSINLKGLNLKKPENRFNTQLLLPGGRGKDVKVAVIADSLASEAQKAGADLIIRKSEITSLAKDKKKLKRIVNEYDWFFGEIGLMADIGKQLGTVLGPRGKMPKPIPPKAKIEPLVKSAKNSIRIAVKETPVIHVVVGTEKLDDQQVANNVEAAYSLIKDKLPKGKNNIKSVLLKLTMGKPVKLEMK